MSELWAKIKNSAASALFPNELRKFLRREWLRLVWYTAAFIVLFSLTFLWWHLRAVTVGMCRWGLFALLGLAWLMVTSAFWSVYKPKDYLASVVSIVAIVVASIGVYYTGRQATLLSQQIQLENRPFVSIEKPLWWYSDDEHGNFWLWLQVRRNNYGEKPAEELRLRNFRAMNLVIHEDALRQKVTERTPAERRQHLGEYVADERNRLVLRLLGIFAEYFRAHPDASQQQAGAFIDSITQTPSKLENFDIGFYDGNSLFARVEVNNEMSDYLANQRAVLFPKQPSDILWTLQFGGGIQDVIRGNNLLVVLLAYEYRSHLKDSYYSTCFLGYSDRNFPDNSLIDRGRGGKFLKEFQVWSIKERN